MTGTVAIIGASRGIGLGLLEAYAADGWRVHATVRDPDNPGRAGRVQGDVHLHALDVRDGAAIEALAQTLAGAGIDVLIHNAGVKGTGTDAADLHAINVDAPIRVVEALLGCLAPGARVVLMSSRMGSRNGRKGRLGAYGESKAALNERFRERADAWAARGVHAAVMHPGWVRTDMGGRGAPLSVAESVAGICRVVAGLDARGHGRFLNWDGDEIPW